MKAVDTVRRDLARGPLVHRDAGADGVPGEDGAFVACSFWLAEALARQGRVDEGATLLEEMLRLAKRRRPLRRGDRWTSGEFLGNFPQGLSHLALISAAVAIEEAAG